MTLLVSLIVVFFLFGVNAEGEVVTNLKGPMGFNENYNFVNTNDQYSLRFLNAGYWSYGWGPFQFTGIWWNSLQATGNHTQPNLEGDYIWGSIYVGSVGTPPISWLGYYGASVSADRNITDKDNFDWVKFNVSVTSSFIASSFLNLVEKDSAGNIVSNQSLSNSLLILNKTKSDELSNKTAGIYAYSFQSGKGPSIEIQYILTQKAGTLDVLDGVLVVPKALETIVYVNNYQYKAPTNFLTLQIAVGTAASTYNANGEIQAGGSNSSSRVFYRLANKAAINGAMKSVKIHIEKASVTQFGNDDVQAQLNQRYEKDASCSIVNIEFEAGAANIVYDPTMGAGDSPFDTNNPGNTSLIVGLSCAGALVIIVVIIVIAVVLRKRSQYQPV